MGARVFSRGVLFGAVLATGCGAPMYVNPGPNPAADPPEIVLVRVVGTADATEPESIAIDGRFLCHNYDPGRRNLPRCPNFDPAADGSKFEIEAYVPVGEHRVSVVGWGEDFVLRDSTLFLPDTVMVCQFTYSSVECIGEASSDTLAELEALGTGPGGEAPTLETSPEEVVDSSGLDETAEAEGAADAPGAEAAGEAAPE